MRIASFLSLFLVCLFVACKKQDTSTSLQTSNTNPLPPQKTDSSKLLLKYYGTTSFKTDDWSAATLNGSYSDSIIVSFPASDSIQFKYFAKYDESTPRPTLSQFRINGSSIYIDSSYPEFSFTVSDLSITMNWVHGVYCGVFGTQTFKSSRK